mmetsp:Transcript_7945/g.22113  ORF Transcript_7945/g.22113 Transcript_7945/m.22113 type:complete len:223 (+) Transcript_7945:88-756(+)
MQFLRAPQWRIHSVRQQFVHALSQHKAGAVRAKEIGNGCCCGWPVNFLVVVVIIIGFRRRGHGWPTTTTVGDIFDKVPNGLDGRFAFGIAQHFRKAVVSAALVQLLPHCIVVEQGSLDTTVVVVVVVVVVCRLVLVAMTRAAVAIQILLWKHAIPPCATMAHTLGPPTIRPRIVPTQSRRRACQRNREWLLLWLASKLLGRRRHHHRFPTKRAWLADHNNRR